jgi:hypothetical protein
VEFDRPFLASVPEENLIRDPPYPHLPPDSSDMLASSIPCLPFDETKLGPSMPETGQSARVRRSVQSQRQRRARALLAGIVLHFLWQPLIVVCFGGDQRPVKLGVSAMKVVNSSREAWR